MRTSTKIYLTAIFAAPVPLGAVSALLTGNFLTTVIGAFIGLVIGLLPQYILFKKQEIRQEKEIDRIKNNHKERMSRILDHKTREKD